MSKTLNSVIIPLEVAPEHVCTLPGKIICRYYERSQFAQIIQCEGGEWFVHKITTGVYFPVRSYVSAKRLRDEIADRCKSIERCFE